ncbi:hypothetical protein POM88_029780 [Heracleum sosnowskyi]|uniref:EDS1 EP domain-containing protein n=1 Tax=Heracleum sosnowskyi TaxID=360622 RepID=A0AAD8HW82_9APIA|nr:hypothetical protein POM88_029780 [Heracleum sosnowskyi]
MSLGVSEEVIKKACELSMKAHECCDESKQYIYDECQLNSTAASVFSFAGAWSVSVGLRELVLVFADGAVKRRETSNFAGHGLGGPMAIFTTLWDCEVRKVCRYDAFKIKANEDDFHAGVVSLQLGGIWNEIIKMLRMNQLPDEFEGNKEWIDLGTRHRRLDEPIAIGSYYVEELMNLGKKKSSDVLKERITSLERQILQSHEAGVLEDGVFFDKSTFTEWWNTLPQQHKYESCIRGIFGMQT